MSTNDSLDLEQFSKKLQNNLKKSQTRAKKIDQEESLPESDKKEGNTFFSEDPFDTKKSTTKLINSNEYETKKNIFPHFLAEHPGHLALTFCIFGLPATICPVRECPHS